MKSVMSVWGKKVSLRIKIHPQRTQTWIICDKDFSGAMQEGWADKQFSHVNPFYYIPVSTGESCIDGITETNSKLQPPLLNIISCFYDSVKCLQASYFLFMTESKHCFIYLSYRHHSDLCTDFDWNGLQDDDILLIGMTWRPWCLNFMIFCCCFSGLFDIKWRAESHVSHFGGQTVWSNDQSVQTQQ